MRVRIPHIDDESVVTELNAEDIYEVEMHGTEKSDSYYCTIKLNSGKVIKFGKTDNGDLASEWVRSAGKSTREGEEEAE